MNIYLNGELIQTRAALLSELIEELSLTGKRIAVEMDGQLVPKTRHATTPLTENVSIEIIQAVGGG